MWASERGQASAEYVGVLALAALAFVTAGALVGFSELPAAVASTVRTGICIVGGDICRDSDARAAGLAPCTVDDRREGGGKTFSVGWVRFGGAHGVLVARRSDGSVLVTKSSESRAGATAGVGVEASPLRLDVGVDGAIELTFTHGSTWEFPDPAAAARFIAGPADVPPAWRYAEAGGELSGAVSAALRGMRLAGIDASAAEVAGVRVGRGQTTLYIRADIDSGASAWPPGQDAAVAGPGGEVIVELTLEHGDPREIAFRSAGHGAGGDRVVETVARLDLRDPVNRAAAQRVLMAGVPAARLLALLRYTVRHGTVERAVYAVRDGSSDFAAAVKLGVELGFESRDVDVERRLVAASAWTPGSQERLRADCLA